jgi:hypothetical protein
MEEARSPQDDLRRRLYAPGATAEDLAAYRAAGGSADPEPAATAAEQPAPAPPRPLPPTGPRRRTVLAGAVLGGASLVAGTVALVAAQPGPARPPATAAPAEPPVQVRLPIPPDASAAFVRALDGAGDVGIGEYLLAHPDARPTAISTPRRAASTEYRGEGAGTIALEPSALADRGGRITVLLVLDQPGKVEWRATRLAESNDRSGPIVPVATGSAVLGPGQIGTTTAAYRGPAPRALLVLVAEQVRWGALVVFTD